MQCSGKAMSLDSHEIRQISQNPPNFMNMSFCVITKDRSFFRKTKHKVLMMSTDAIWRCSLPSQYNIFSRGKLDETMIGICRTLSWSIHPFYVNPKFGNTYCVNHVVWLLSCKYLNVTEKTSQKWYHTDTIILWITILIIIGILRLSYFSG